MNAIHQQTFSLQFAITYSLIGLDSRCFWWSGDRHKKIRHWIANQKVGGWKRMVHLTIMRYPTLFSRAFHDLQIKKRKSTHCWTRTERQWLTLSSSCSNLLCDKQIDDKTVPNMTKPMNRILKTGFTQWREKGHRSYSNYPTLNFCFCSRSNLVKLV